jgi:hypothetical protein
MLWAVGYINWFDHDLQIEVVEADSWQSAVKASKFEDLRSTMDEADEAEREDLELFKHLCFDGDSMCEVKLIPLVTAGER